MNAYLESVSILCGIKPESANKINGKNVGFIRFKDREQADACVTQLNGTELEGSKITLFVKEPKAIRPDQQYPTPKPTPRPKPLK